MDLTNICKQNMVPQESDYTIYDVQNPAYKFNFPQSKSDDIFSKNEDPIYIKYFNALWNYYLENHQYWICERQ